MAEITVQPRGAGRFLVHVDEDGSRTVHEVTVSADDLERLAAGRTPEAFVRACFGFLLEREPKEAILPAFDVGEIRRYFPEFDETIVSGRAG